MDLAAERPESARHGVRPGNRLTDGDVEFPEELLAHDRPGRSGIEQRQVKLRLRESAPNRKDEGTGVRPPFGLVCGHAS